MHVVEGVVRPGDRRGRTLGFPTANISVEATELDGVWAGLVEVSPGLLSTAVVSVGCRRTFYLDQGQRLLEAHLLDLDMDLYGRHLRVHLMRRLRGQKKFGSVEELIEQVHIDARLAREWAVGHYPSLAGAGRAEVSTEVQV